MEGVAINMRAPYFYPTSTKMVCVLRRYIPDGSFSFPTDGGTDGHIFKKSGVG